MQSLGIDVGGTSVKLALLQDKEVLWTARSDEYNRPNTDDLIAAMKQAASGKSTTADVVGLCVPGLLDHPTRTITMAVNVPGVVGIPLDELVGRAFGATGQIKLINDAVAAATDALLVRKLSNRVLCLALGTGVGPAVLDDGKPLRVENESPGHIGQADVSIEGHPVIGPDGGAGSLEGYIGIHALRKRYGPEFLSRLTIDEPPIKALVRAIRIGHAMYRPQHVLLLGGVGVRLKHLIPQIKQAVDHQLTSVARAGWTLEAGADDFHAARGAARLASDQ
jgi:glucokinase